MYARTNVAPKSELKGQAAVVFSELGSTPELATTINERVAPKLKTRQDPLRVTLYYLIIFKNRGIVAASEQPAEVVAEAPIADESDAIAEEHEENVDNAVEQFETAAAE
jgi:hypothetical protein